MRPSARSGFEKLSLEKATAAYAVGDFAEAAKWIALVPADKQPSDLAAALHFRLAGVAATEQRWAEATREMTSAVQAAPTNGQYQQRLALLRQRRPLMDDHAWVTMSEVIDPAIRLLPDDLAPEVSSVWACGAYFSRAGGRAAPWSRYLSISKNPDPDPTERTAVFKLATGYFCRFIAEETCALASADVVVPIPADPSRYATRMASLPDELATAVQDQLGLPAALFALESTGKGIEMKQLSRADRRVAASQAFQPSQDRNSIRGRGVLLVDDVITSGSTLRSAATLLLELGATTVVAVALSHTEG